MSEAKTSLWDASEHLNTPEAINEYLTAALEDGDSLGSALALYCAFQGCLQPWNAKSQNNKL